MNFLAHAYLSFDHSHLLVGNMISDFVKGKAKDSFVEGIRKGIILHRNIDEFTDNHPATQKAKEIFRPYYRLYSGPIVDVLYDHFLANDETIFSEASLKAFTTHTYNQLEDQAAHLPERFIMVFTYMKADDWLFNYRRKEGIQRSLKGLIRRATYLSESETAYNLFLSHYVTLNEYYREFFEDVKLFAKKRIEEILL